MFTTCEDSSINHDTLSWDLSKILLNEVAVYQGVSRAREPTSPFLKTSSSGKNFPPLDAMEQREEVVLLEHD